MATAQLQPLPLQQAFDKPQQRPPLVGTDVTLHPLSKCSLSQSSPQHINQHPLAAERKGPQGKLLGLELERK